MDLTASFSMSLKMVPNETCCCQTVVSRYGYQMCLGDVRQCCRQWGEVAIYRGKLGETNHFCCFPSGCLQLGLSDGAPRSRCSARTRKLLPCAMDRLLFLCLTQRVVVQCLTPAHPFSLFCFGIKGLREASGNY